MTELAVTRRLRLAGKAAAASEARRFVATVLADWAVPDLIDDVCIVTSELVTNALLHAGTDIEISIGRTDARGLRVGVTDSDTSGVLPPLELPTRRPSLLEDTSDDEVLESLLVAEAATGRGLQLVQAIASDWGVDRSTDGKTVWAVLGGSAAPTAPGAASTPSSRSVPPARAVRLIAVPVSTALASELNLDALEREAHLVAAGTSQLAAARELLAATQQTLCELAVSRHTLRAALHAAVARGDRLQDINLLLPLDGTAKTAELLRLLEAVAAYSRRGALLSFAPTPEMQAFRGWCAQEVARQLAGSRPRPCPLPAVAPAAHSQPAPAALEGQRIAALERVQQAAARAENATNILHILLNEAVGELGGARASVCLLGPDNETVTIAESVGYPADVRSHWEAFAVSADLPASETIRSGQSVVMRTTEERNARYPVFARTPVLDDAATITMPLATGLLPALGCLVIGFSRARDFTARELGFLEEICHAAAEALQRVQTAAVHSDETVLTSHVESLLEKLWMIVEPDAYLTALARGLVPGLADWCSVHVRDDDGGPRFVTAAHPDPALAQLAAELYRRWPAQPGQRSIGWCLETGLTQVFQVVPPELLTAIAQDDDHLDVLQRLGLGSGAVAAITGDGEVHGVLAIANAPGRYITDGELHLLETLARKSGAHLARITPRRPD